jgi:NAD(P)-dependent dehydrogenase (short-subunit alcohol dehydrogenase family)
VVLTSSGAATNSYSTWGAYCASKAALRSLGQTLSVEEKAITTISVAPGVVDTEMQQALRDRHISRMDEKDQQKFTSLHQEGKLLKPEQPGNVMARLVVGAPKDLSGRLEKYVPTNGFV